MSEVPPTEPASEQPVVEPVVVPVVPPVEEAPVEAVPQPRKKKVKLTRAERIANGTWRTNKGKKIDWNHDLDYETTLKRFVEQVAKARAECETDSEGGVDPWAPTRLAHWSCALIQLTNACRASEAFDGLRLWAENAPKDDYEVRVRKKRQTCATCHHPKVTTSRDSRIGHRLIDKKTGERGQCNMTVWHPDTQTLLPCPCTQFVNDPLAVKLRAIDIPPELLADDVPYLVEALNRGMDSAAYECFVKRNLHYGTHALRYCRIIQWGKDGVPPQMIASITGHSSLDILIRYTGTKAGRELLKKSVQTRPVTQAG